MADRIRRIEERLDRIEKAIETMAWWLVAAQTGFGEQDARGIVRILEGADDAEEING
jgi:hypothetical protein